MERFDNVGFPVGYASATLSYYFENSDGTVEKRKVAMSHDGEKKCVNQGVNEPVVKICTPRIDDGSELEDWESFSFQVCY